MTPQLFHSIEPFTLESGQVLPRLHLAYTTLGKLNAAKDNVVWIFHALTANSNPAEWWPGLVGNGKLFDPATHFIVCVNMPGSHYGSLSPLDIDETTGEPFYHQFPLFTTRDMIRSYQRLKTQLGIEKIKVGIGGSMGGQQLLEWAVEEPELFDTIVPIATNAQHSPWGIAFNATQRFCIEQDVTWKERNAQAGLEGMKTARAIALLSYRNYDTYAATQQGYADNKTFRAETYQAYQGEKLAKRFNAFSYYFLSKGMDGHDVGRGRGSVEKALATVKAKTLVIAISSDILFPPTEQKFLAAHIPGASLVVIHSFYGHDGFLLEYEKISAAINSFQRVTPNFPIHSN
jgi:homoserine O-acetyltransferase/O-succinyltransferase